MLKYALLALLAQHPRHGYDLKVEYDQILGLLSQPVNIGQIYSTLQRLEQAGQVVAERDDKSGRERTVYTLTAEGRAALDEWLHSPTEPENLRSDFFDKLVAHRLVGHHTQMFDLIRSQRMVYLQWLSDLTKSKARLPDDAPALTQLLISHAIRQLEAELMWLDECEVLLNESR